MTDMKGSTSTDPDMRAQHKEWDEISCPICMDHPHNAVLLICTSHEKGCRSFICDTSYRHSNCLDRFKKSRVSPQGSPSQPSVATHDNVGEDFNQRDIDTLASEPSFGIPRTRRNVVETNEDYGSEENDVDVFPGLPDALENGTHRAENLYSEAQAGEGNHEESDEQNALKSDKLQCPLCRGTVMGWMIIKEVRQYLDLKTRSCARESCSFLGSYRELRRHARRVHPSTRPADVDPSRQRAWRRLEHQQEYGDIISAIRSAMPGAIFFGDYVIDSGDGLPHNRDLRDLGDGGGQWWTTFFLFHMISSGRNSSLYGRRGLARTWRHRRPSRNRYLWGENLLGLQDDDEEDDDDVRILDEDDVSIPRRRRRFVRARTDELP